MGYQKDLIDAQFVIEKENIDKAYEAIKDACMNNTPREALGVAESDQVAGPWFMDHVDNLGDALFEAGFDTVETESGGIEIIGSHDGWPSVEAYVAAAVAPFVKSGSFLTWEGEDYERYRYEFEGGKFFYATPVVTWERDTTS